MGASQAIIALVQNLTNYQEKWSIFVALAPPLSLKKFNDSPFLRFLSDKMTTDVLINTLRALNAYEVYPSNWMNSAFFTQVCTNVLDICLFGQKLVADTNPELNSDVATKVYFAHYPSGSSLREFDHFFQLARAEKFLRYDHGPHKNMQIYGELTPPEVNISSITGIPIAVIAGTQDMLSTLADTRWIME